MGRARSGFFWQDAGAKPVVGTPQWQKPSTSRSQTITKKTCKTPSLGTRLVHRIPALKQPGTEAGKKTIFEKTATLQLRIG